MATSVKMFTERIPAKWESSQSFNGRTRLSISMEKSWMSLKISCIKVYAFTSAGRCMVADVMGVVLEEHSFCESNGSRGNGHGASSRGGRSCS